VWLWAAEDGGGRDARSHLRGLRYGHAGRLVPAAAGLLDYDALAQAANSDWDSFPSGQQHQITTKMREDAAGRLAAMGYPATGMTVSGTVIAGARATLAAAGGGQSLTLTLAQTEAGWQIVAGLPTMTTE